MKPFRVGIDSYSLSPLRLAPFDVLAWTHRHGGAGVQFSEINLPEGRGLDDGLLRELAQQARDLGLYLEWGGAQHIPFDTDTWQPKDLLAINTTAARQARSIGATIVRSCSGGLMRWGDTAPPTEALLRAMADTLKAQQPMLRDLNVVLAIELHFEFTTFELLRVFERCGAEPGGPLGICLDTMNLLTMLEDPVAGTERILPWVVATHIKDGGLMLSDTGLTSFTAEVGTGLVDLRRILALLCTLDHPLNLSIEDHGGQFDIPIFDETFLTRFPDLRTTELARLVQMAHVGRQRVAAGTLAPLPRLEWPQLCAARVARGLRTLQHLVAQLSDGAPPPCGPAASASGMNTGGHP